jgi:hypothetical protein
VSSDDNPHALAPGTRILDYTIESVIGTGGFSIVYRALDNSLERQVAIKEYFPASLAQRDPGGTVQPHSREVDTFRTGIVSFMNEGKLLAQFDHPALVRVYRCWEERGTAYLAMRLCSGITLREAVKTGAWKVDEFSMHALLAPLCETLSLLHAANCFHRDVAPDNILLADGQAPVLLDFGAARKAIEGTQVFTAILKPGYAPIEQYGDGELKQGPWTDIYALAGVMHFALTGEAPPTAISRMLRDSMPKPRERFAGRLPDTWLDAMEKALSVKPENRPQNIAEFVELFRWNEVAPLPVDPEPQTAFVKAPKPAAVLPPEAVAGAAPVTPPVSVPAATAVAVPASAPAPAPLITQLMRDAERADALDDDRTVVMPRRAATVVVPPPVAEQPVAQPAAITAASAVPVAPPASAQPSLRPRPAATPQRSGSHGLLIGSAVLVAVAIALGAWQFMRPKAPVAASEVPQPTPAVRIDAAADTKTSLPKEAPAIAPTAPVLSTASDRPVVDPVPETPPKTAPAPSDPAAAKPAVTPPVAGTTKAAKQEKQETRAREPAPRVTEPADADTTEDDIDETPARANRRKARCVALVESFQLGNVLSNQEQRYLRDNCR